VKAKRPDGQYKMGRLPARRAKHWEACRSKSALLKVVPTDEYAALVESKSQRAAAAPTADGHGDRQHSVDVSPGKTFENNPSLKGVCTCKVPEHLGIPCSHVMGTCDALTVEGADVDAHRFMDPRLTTQAMRSFYCALGSTALPGTVGLKPDGLLCPSWTKCSDVEAADDVQLQVAIEAEARKVEEGDDVDRVGKVPLRGCSA